MKLIIGLGNPGTKYKQTRHNIGFIIIDYIAAQLGAEFKFTKKYNAEIAKLTHNGEPVILTKPQTFMNESGRSVHKISDFYNIKTENILVIHDDIDLEPLKVKYQKNRGAGGNHGIESIINHLHSKNFARLRIGIGRPTVGDPASYVLKDFTKQEWEALQEYIPEINEYILNFITNK